FSLSWLRYRSTVTAPVLLRGFFIYLTVPLPSRVIDQSCGRPSGKGVVIEASSTGAPALKSKASLKVGVGGVVAAAEGVKKGTAVLEPGTMVVPGALTGEREASGALFWV